MKILSAYFLFFAPLSFFAIKNTRVSAGGLKTEFNTTLPKKGNTSYNGKLAIHNGDLVFSGGVIAVFPIIIYDNDVIGGSAGPDRLVTIKNTGTGILSVSSVNLSGTNFNQFILSNLPGFPININSGDSISFKVAFNPSSIGLKTASISITSDDASNPSTIIALRGLGTRGLGGSNEPSLQALLNLLQIEAQVGDDNITTAVINSDAEVQKSQLLGDEISLQKFQKAQAGNVTITPLAVFGPTDSSTVVGMGWYKSGDSNTTAELFTVPNVPLLNGQTVHADYTGTFTFDPNVDTFGFYSHWPRFDNRYIYSEDVLNTFPLSVSHHVRVYPYKKNGVVIPDSYLVAFEESTSALDYNDLLFVVSNVKKVQSNALIFVENRDNFPSNDLVVFSRLQTPWTSDSVHYNANHDSVKLRIYNNGMSPLIISNLVLSNDTTWKIERFNGSPYIQGAGLPVSIASASTVDLTLRFTAENQGTRVKVLHETLTIISNDDKYPLKIIKLNGLWQNMGEGNNEPYAREIIEVFGYTSQTGFGHTDFDEGDSTKLKGSEIKPSFFVRADDNFPVTARQVAAYHSCCNSTERLKWYNKGSSTINNVFTQIIEDGQTVLPRKSLSGSPAAGVFTPAGAFGFNVGSNDFSDALKNPGFKIGIRIWKALNAEGQVIPNSYIIANDYLGTSVTNYDYQDNTYFVSNIKPETGTAFYSILTATPSDLDFGEKLLGSADWMLLNIKSLGNVYPDSSRDPSVKISSVEITGENNSEFTADMPLNASLSPQELSTIKVTFTPLSQGLKIADLLIHYNSGISPLRVPLYGIAKKPDSIVVVNYRIKSGTNKPITINGKTWIGDSSFAFDNLEPYANPGITDIAATDDDSLYLVEQSSNGTRRSFRYEIPLAIQGNYAVRLHFAEIYWGLPGGAAGGAGSRVLSVRLENQLRLINFDIAQEVGSAEAIIKNFPVTVSDGKLNITFSASINRPALSAVEVYSFLSSGPLAADEFILKGRLAMEGVKLNWVNTNENSTLYYEIQRSTGTTGFTTIGKVFSSNALNYNFTDSNATAVNNFYRIRKVSFDNKTTFSKIIRIDIPSSLTMKLFPNPGSNKLRIEYRGITGTRKANISVQNVSGSTIKNIPVILSGQKIEVDVSSLSPGVYIVRLITDDKTLKSRFLKK